MAPETVCMLVVWVETVEATELRATCWTLKRAVDETAPWMMKRAEDGTVLLMLSLLSATDVSVMARALLHAPHHLQTFSFWATQAGMWMGNTEALELMRGPEHKWSVWSCMWAARHGHLDVLKTSKTFGVKLHWWAICDAARENGREHVLVWAHDGVRSTWPCYGNACDWALEHKTNEL